MIMQQEKFCTVDRIISKWFRQHFTQEISLKNLVMIITKYVAMYKEVPFDKSFMSSRLMLTKNFEIMKYGCGNALGSIARLKYALLYNSKNIIHFHLKLKNLVYILYWQIGILSNKSKLPKHSINSARDGTDCYPYAHLLDDEERIRAPKSRDEWPWFN